MNVYSGSAIRITGVMSQYCSSCSHIFSALTLNIAVQRVSPLLPVPSPNLSLETWLRFLSVPSGKFRNITYIKLGPSASFRILSHSLFTDHPTVLCGIHVFRWYNIWAPLKPCTSVCTKQTKSSAKMIRNYEVFFFIVCNWNGSALIGLFLVYRSLEPTGLFQDSLSVQLLFNFDEISA
jgi:hypothetical protein